MKVTTIPDRVTLLFHDGCSRAHWSLGEIRKCTGRFVHGDQVTAVTYVSDQQVKPVHSELSDWLTESEGKILRSPLGYHYAYLQKLRAQLARLLELKPLEADVDAEHFVVKMAEDAKLRARTMRSE